MTERFFAFLTTRTQKFLFKSPTTDDRINDYCEWSPFNNPVVHMHRWPSCKEPHFKIA